jgi:CRISPR/Cas system CSM-associated protein Csm3 (group 7 of RAMP superfamily)
MPQGEPFWNPYRLIPIRETVERTAPWTHERFRGHSGIITCTLENLTPLFVGGQTSGSQQPPLLREGKRVVPGSSIKGMLRTLAEIAGGGCCVIQDRESPSPDDLKACSHMDQLCISCRMFGAMGRGRNAQVHLGKVSIGDAVIRDNKLRATTLHVLLSNNGTRHKPFYRSPQTGKLDGKSRKLYFHQPKHKEKIRPVGENQNVRAIEALLSGHQFDFQLQFTSLTDSELSLLLYVLCLEERVAVAIGDPPLQLNGPMRHKIGKAKPLGLGSCHLRVAALLHLPPPDERFKTIASAPPRVLEGDALLVEIRQRTQPYVQDQSPVMVALRKMMVWDETDPREFRYPEYHWFKNPANSQEALKEL